MGHSSSTRSALRIALATPARNAWSETFIAAHIKRLNDVVLVLSGGMPPIMADEISLLTPTDLPSRLRNAFDRRLLRKDNAIILRERTVAQLRKKRVDVLLAEYGPMGEALIETAQATGIPLVVHFHGYDAHRKEPLERHDNYKRLFKHAAALIVVSRAMEQHLLALGAPRERLHYLVYGTDAERFTPGNPAHVPPRFLAVGRFTDKKAPQLTLLAFRAAWLQRPEARLTMVGTGELWEGTRQLVKALGMESVVELPGVLPPEQVAQHMRNARAFVQHSVTTSANDMEGTPLAVLEAMASGLPVIATRHAGIPDVVDHGVRGLLSNEYDIDRMAAHMVQLIDEPETAAAMGRAGRAYIMEHHRMQDRIGALQGLLGKVAVRRT